MDEKTTHTTHFNDCGCLSSRKDAEIAELKDTMNHLVQKDHAPCKEMWEASRDREKVLVEALKEVVAVLGPEPADCGCEGCECEMGMALDAANKALAMIDRSKSIDQTPTEGL